MRPYTTIPILRRQALGRTVCGSTVTLSLGLTQNGDNLWVLVVSAGDILVQRIGTPVLGALGWKAGLGYVVFDHREPGLAMVGVDEEVAGWGGHVSRAGDEWLAES
jgi:hypothetical protein